jgi:hypothetical protein
MSDWRVASATDRGALPAIEWIKEFGKLSKKT